LIYLVAEAIGTEARATYNYASAHGDYDNMKGASCFAPFINLMRDPLWGRVQVNIVLVIKCTIRTDGVFCTKCNCIENKLCPGTLFSFYGSV